MKKITLAAISLFLFALVAPVAAIAQATASATIVGSATDASGAVVGAHVTATSKATGATRTTVVNTSGDFRFDQVAPGSYTIRVTKDGYATYEQNVDLLVGQTATVAAVMKVGQTSQVVEVHAADVVIDLAKTEVAQQISPQEVDQLPMLGRDSANLAYLVPGVKAADSYDPTKNRSAVLSVNGASGRNVNVTVNGVDNKDNTVGGTVMQVPLEAVEEFNISTQRFSAANGRSEGAVINLITKSGTNQLHGSLFSFFRDQALNSDQKTANGDGTYTLNNSPYARQQFGGSFGGPIAKDKLFAFFAYERQREHTSITDSAGFVSEISLLTGIGAVPATVIPTPFFDTRYNGRMDYLLNQANKMSFSYTSQGNNSNNDQSAGNGDLTSGNTTTNQLQLASFNWGSTISQTLVNQFTAGYQYWNNKILATSQLPNLNFNGGATIGTNGNVPQQSFQRKWQMRDDISKVIGKHTVSTGVDYIWEQALGGYFKFNTPIQVDFNIDPSDLGSTPDQVAKALGSTKGLVNDIIFATGDPATNVPNGTKQLGLYVQDDWKATRRLTLNLGVRYDRDFNMVEANTIGTSRTYLELKAASAFNSSLLPFVNKIASDDALNFSPRVGFAYDVFGKGTDVVRGGFGLYYGDIFQNIPIFMEQQHNPFIYQAYEYDLGDGQVLPGYTNTTVDDFTYTQANINQVLSNLPPPSKDLLPGSTGFYIDPNYKNPVTEEFNAGWAHSFNNISSLEVDYVHVLGLHENKTRLINPKLPLVTNGVVDYTKSYRPLTAAFQAAEVPVLGSVRDESSIGRSRYDGLNVSYKQRLSHRFSLNASYTLAWAYGYDENPYHSYAKDPLKQLNPRDWGPNPNDERHHISVSGIIKLPAGFDFAPILQYGSARPYDITSPKDYTGYGNRSALYGVLVPVNDQTNYTYALTSGLSAAQLRAGYFGGTLTTAKWDPLRGDPTFNLDARLAKNIKFRERLNLQLIAQAFDLTNRANYGSNFGTNIGSSNYRKPVGWLNPNSSITPRSLIGEFGFRFSF
ncbi:TonB-dependent receptor [Occallatibacter savannae]|uniref:TonB-dependent receptor n=1 Tax=Occallatibacter savannae TaxID=1002691 RepID=UPI000D6994A1|nr:TonB-dependent receptor [Occallatibacter savannae]